MPGIIAFAVDFSNGTIYLPGPITGSIDNLDDMPDPVVVDAGGRKLTRERIEFLIHRHTGRRVNLRSPDISVRQLGSDS